MNRKNSDNGDVSLATIVSSLMAMALGLGLDVLNAVDGLNAWLAQAFNFQNLSAPTKSFSDAFYWLISSGVALCLAATILNIPGHWRRVLVWVTTFFVTLFWGPVMVLAGYKPEIGLALIAVIWSGFCALFYSISHRMPADEQLKK